MSNSFPQWRELHAERLSEAAISLAAVPGIVDLVLGGSVARDEHWPLSDIDLIPIWRAGAVDERAMAERQAAMVDWWAASGRAQTLDVSWIRFEDDEVREALAGGPEAAAQHMQDLRWFHGLDKIYGGRSAVAPNGIATEFARWATKVRFDPLVRKARIAVLMGQVDAARAKAEADMQAGDDTAATLGVRAAASALRIIYLESWGQRLGSMGREWTIWERIAGEHGVSDVSRAIADLVDANAEDALDAAQSAPIWLQERIRLALEARQSVGEPVTPAQNARDQLAAFRVHVTKRRQPPWDPWLRLPASDVGARLESLDAAIDRARSIIERS